MLYKIMIMLDKITQSKDKKFFFQLIYIFPLSQ